MKNEWYRHIVAAGLLGLASLSLARGSVSGIECEQSDKGVVFHIRGTELGTPKVIRAFKGKDYILQFNAPFLHNNQKLGIHHASVKYAKMVNYRSRPHISRFLVVVEEGQEPKLVKTAGGYDVIVGHWERPLEAVHIPVGAGSSPNPEVEKAAAELAKPAQAAGNNASDKNAADKSAADKNTVKVINADTVKPAPAKKSDTNTSPAKALPTAKSVAATKVQTSKPIAPKPLAANVHGPAAPSASQLNASTDPAGDVVTNLLAMKEDKLVSVDFVGANVDQVLRGIALQSGLNVVMQDLGDKATQKVNVSIAHMKAIDAMHLVAAMANLKVAHVDGTYLVTTEEAYPKVMSQLANRNGETNLMKVIPLASGQGLTIKNAVDKWFGQVPLQVMVADQGQAAEAVKAGGSMDAGKAATGKGSPYLILIGSSEWVDKGDALVQKLDAGIVHAQNAEAEKSEAALNDPDNQSHLVLYNVKYADPRALRDDLALAVPGLEVTVPPASVGNLSAYESGREIKAALAQKDMNNGNSNAAAAGGGSSSSSSGASFGTDSGAVSGLSAPFQAMEKDSVPMRIVLHGTDREIKEAMEYLKVVDVAPREIALELRVMELSKEDAIKLGINWSLLTGGAVNTINLNESQGGIGTNTAPANSIGGSISGRGFNAGVTATLDAIANKNNLIARPNLLAMDGREAEIFVGSDVKYIQSIQSTQNGVTVQTGDVPVGVRLAVLPHVGGEGNITMDLRPVVSVLTGFTSVPGGGQLPQTSLRISQSTVEMKSGETIAIGGLIQDQDALNVQKVPILGDLPIIGNLFRSTSHDRQRTEVVFFVTVREVNPNHAGAAADPAVAEQNNPTEYPIPPRKILH